MNAIILGDGGFGRSIAAALIARGVIRDGDEVVAILSGNGVKTPDARRFGLGDDELPAAEPIAATYRAFSERYLG